MFDHLQIANPRERALVAAADLGLAIATLPSRWRRRTPRQRTRVLVFRFERTGDLIMARPALAALRAAVPDAHIELAIGSWNRELISWLPEVDEVTVLDLPWLSRGSATARFDDLRAAVRRWRRSAFDTAINLEGDIRSHLLMRATGIPERFGFDMAGGGPVLTHRVPYDPTKHVADNGVRLIERVFDRPTGSMAASMPPLILPEGVRAEGTALLADAGDGPLVGIHPSGGRAIKQWDLAALAAAAATVAAKLGATVVLTGTPGDRAIADTVRAGLPTSIRVVDLVGRAGLGALAAVLERLTVFISADTGPMHISAALGTPTVGIFGPSDPARWGPLGPHTRVVRVGIWCSPCNLIRNPPERCRGHVPDCLVAVTPAMVVAAALAVAAERPHGSLHGRA